MNAIWQRSRAVLTVLLAGGLVLAACTRSASSNAVPTVTVSASSGGVTQQPIAQDPTMAALGTAIRMTQTAQAVAGVGGGGEVTVTPGGPAGGVTPAAAVATTAAPPSAVPATPVPVGACPNPYTVKSGDWIYKIARECRVEPSAIIAANPGINPSALTPGQKLNMPTAGATPVPGATKQACTGTHTVAKGENLFRIAYNCGLTTEQLAAPNGIPYPYTIFPGQVLRFP